MKNKFYLILLMAFACAPNKNSDEEKPQIQFLISPVKEKSGEPSLFADKDGKVYMSWLCAGGLAYKVGSHAC